MLIASFFYGWLKTRAISTLTRATRPNFGHFEFRIQGCAEFCAAF